MREFTPGQSADVVHSSLKTAVRAMEKAQQNAVLWFGEVLDRKLYQELGYSSMNQYAEQELGFSKTKASDFMGICRKLKSLPKIEEGLRTGELGYTTVRVITQVADPENEAAWVHEAKTKPRCQVERQVKKAKKRAAEKPRQQLSLMPDPEAVPEASPPVRVSFELSPVQYARYEALWEKVRDLGGVPAEKAEALLEVLERYVAGSSPRGNTVGGVSNFNDNESPSQGVSSAEQDNTEVAAGRVAPVTQINIHLVTATNRATVQTNKGELVLSPAELEQAQCDCRVHRPGQRSQASIPPGVRRQVLARDGHRCQRPGCGHTGHLQVHHIVPRARGGGNEPGNLVTLFRVPSAAA